MHNIKGSNSANLVTGKVSEIDRTKKNRDTIVGSIKIKKDGISRPFLSMASAKTTRYLLLCWNLV
jgi:hypothetical protein